MRSHRLVFAVAVLCAASGAPSLAAQATRHHYQQASGEADLTIRVPVSLTNLDASVSQAQVYCVATFAGDDARVQANNQVDVPLANGAYKGDVNVKLALSVAQSGEKWDYTCKLSLYNGNTKEWSVVGALPWSQPQAGTTPSPSNSGSVEVR